MAGTTQNDLAGDIAAAFAWWREAGVGYAYTDEPRRWLAPLEDVATAEPERAPPRRSAAPPPPEPLRIGGDPALWPTDLAAFHAWWMTEPSLGEGGTLGRVPPRGNAGARLMILVEQPESEDREQLLSGPQGRLLAQMLAAMGIPEAETYLASALPRPDPLPDWPALASAGLGALLRHHAQLAAPERLLVLGSNILPLLGHDLAQSAQTLPPLNHEGRTIPLFGERGLPNLARPRAKAGFWQRWLDWTAA